MVVCLHCTRAAWEGFRLLQHQPNASLALLTAGGIILRKNNKIKPSVLEGEPKWHYQILSTFTMPKVLGYQNLLSFVHTVQSYPHLEPVLLSLLLPGFNEPADCSDLVEKFYKGGQMSQVAAFSPSSCPSGSWEGRLCQGSLCPALQSVLSMQCALEMVQLRMQTHLGQPRDVGFIKFHC